MDLGNGVDCYKKVKICYIGYCNFRFIKDYNIFRYSRRKWRISLFVLIGVVVSILTFLDRRLLIYFRLNRDKK